MIVSSATPIINATVTVDTQMTEFFAPSFVLGQSVICIAIRWTSSTPQVFRLVAIIIAATKYFTWNGKIFK